MSVVISRQVWESSRQSGAAFTVLLALADYATDDGVAYPSIESLARKARLSERMTQYAIAQLKRSGEVLVEAGGGRHRTQQYVIQLPETVQSLHRNGHVETVQNSAERVQSTTETVQQLHPIAQTERVQNLSERVQNPAETVQSLHRIDRKGATVAPSPLVLSTKEVRKTKTQSRIQDDAVREIYDYYREHVYPASRTCAADKIRARLKTFTAEELKRGIDNFAASAWSMEHNAKRGCAWFFHSDQRSEMYLNMEAENAPQGEPVQAAASPVLAKIAPATHCDAELWDAALAELRTMNNAANFETYLEPLELAGRGADGGLRLIVSPLMADGIKRFRGQIASALATAGDLAPGCVGFVARRHQENTDEGE